MPHCSHCKQEIICPEHKGKEFGHQAIDHTVFPCAKTCSIWVRAVDDKGAPVPGMSAKSSGKSDQTKGTGFAKLEDLPAGPNTVQLALLEGAADDYQPLSVSQSTREETLATGDLKLITVTVKSRITPLMKVSAPAVAVHGKTATITLTTDLPYDGAGTFTCTQGADRLKFTPALDNGKLDIKSFSGSQTITVEALADPSDLNGVAFEWKIDPSAQKGLAKTATMTVVKAELKVYKKSGPALSDSEKSGDGRTVHLQKPGKDWTRAKAEVLVLPAGYEGHVWLTLTKPKVKLYDKDKLGTAADLSAKIPVGPGKKPEYFVGGVDVSTKKADTILQLKIDELSEVVDECNFTVMETTLQICAPRVDAKTEPAAMPDDRKSSVGRTLYKQRTKLTGQRALLRVTKVPLDAPCKLHLVASAGGDKIAYYEATGEKTHTDMTTNLPVTSKHSNENPVESVAGKTFPREIAVDEVKDLNATPYKAEEKHLYRGLVFWLEGAAVSTLLETKLQVDAEEVDDSCDQVACTVAQPKLEIEIARKPTHTLDDDVDFKLTAPGKDAALLSGVIPKATGKVALNVDAGFYGLAVTPRNASEKEMRLMRLEPKDSETSLSVFADTKVKLELLPPYEKVQCVGYFMRTGAYLGVDGPVPAVTYLSTDNDTERERKRQQFRDDRRLEALNDIDGRCAIMLDAVQNAYNATGVLNSDEKVVKIFMAPEFYFRGEQGAYPLETMEEILTPPKTPSMSNIEALKKELDDAKYQDWIFVLGSAIGAIELDSDPQRTEVSGQITAVSPNIKLNVWLENSNPACNVANGWKLFLEDSGKSGTITAAAQAEAGTSYSRYLVELGLDVIFPDSTPIAFGNGVDTVQFLAKHAMLTIDSPSIAPQVNWFVKQGVNSAKILQVTPVSASAYKLKVNLAFEGALSAGTVKLDAGSTQHPADITGVIDSAVYVQHASGSSAANVAAKWRFWNQAAGPPVPIAANQSYIVDAAATVGTDRKVLVFQSHIVQLTVGDKLIVGDLFPVEEVVSEKLVTIDVQFSAPVVIAKGQFFEMGGDARGLVESTSDLGANKHRISIWMPLEQPHGLTVGDAVTFSTPGSAEILNVALVRKGGSGTPVRADGGAQKELLVYKESVSSVDFEGIDYSRNAFVRNDRQVIRLYGDPSRKAKATVGASNPMSTSPNEPGASTLSGARITETNRSGLGGGSIFTMDGITFGLEVCLDHLCQKLVRYFHGLPGPPAKPAAAVSGEPKVQVQLIPSCGMSIKPASICTVSDGIVFNVDAYGYGCKKDGGGADATQVGSDPLAPPTAATYFITTETPQTGFIEVFEAIDKPTKEFV